MQYRRASIRLPHHDYTAPGFYFVTICTRDMRCYLGDVKNDEVELSEIGQIVEEEWLKTKEIRPNVCLDEWGIMPNHIHVIIQILETSRQDVSQLAQDVCGKLVANSLGSIIGQFKSKCTKRIWAQGFSPFAWQPRFYDHIIRNEKSLGEIRKYINQNPFKWNKDEYNPNIWLA